MRVREVCQDSFARLHLADILDAGTTEEEVVGVGQDVRRLVIAARRLEDLEALSPISGNKNSVAHGAIDPGETCLSLFIEVCPPLSGTMFP